MNLIDKHGNTIPNGSIIRWHAEDSDDFVVWTMTGLVVDHTQLNPPFNGETQHVVYLGGGCDFGAIGKKKSFEEVTETSENNDDDMRGIEVIGKASEMARWISRFTSEKEGKV